MSTIYKKFPNVAKLDWYLFKHLGLVIYYYLNKTRPIHYVYGFDSLRLHYLPQEYEFLKQQKKNFHDLIITLEKQIAILTKTKTRISKDILIKSQTIAIEESCANRNMANVDTKLEYNINTKRNK